MSKYYKAEDVINLLATEYYTHALANSLVKVEDYKVVAERNTKHLPTIEASEDCSDNYKGYCARYEDGCFHQCVQKQVSEGNDCMLTMFGECSYNETGCGSCAVAEKIRKALSVEVSEDCISREWVLQMLTTYEKDHSSANELDEWQNRVVEWIEMDIEDAPSVVPNGHSGESTEKVGEWIVKANGNNECSVCGREKQNGWVNFCGFCGAKMKGEGDEKSMQGM